MKLLSQFQKILKNNQILTQKEVLEKYNVDWTGIYKGNSELALLPQNTQEVSEILKICHQNNQSIITIGGNTNLVAGTVPLNQEIILSTEKMKNFEFDNKTHIVTTEAGVILQSIQEEILKEGFETPFNLGARGSCTIGGNIATNAGGINYLRYGSLRNYIVGMEVVLSDGKVLNMMKEIQKNNTGLDLKQMFIGTEGSLGIITKLKMLCKPIGQEKVLLLFKVRDFQNVIKICDDAKRNFNNYLNALEYLDYETYAMLCQMRKTGDKFFGEDLKEVFYKKNIFENQKNREHFLIVELVGNDKENLLGQAEKFFDLIEGCYEDSVFAESQTQIEEVWEIREESVSASVHFGKSLKYDLSLNFQDFEDITNKTRELFGDIAKVVHGYGHIGDGNIHLQVVLDKDDPQIKEKKHQIDDFVYKEIIRRNGSISAEHGVGEIKKKYLHFQVDNQQMEKLREIKQLFDPKSILNPGKTVTLDQNNLNQNYNGIGKIFVFPWNNSRYLK